MKFMSKNILLLLLLIVFNQSCFSQNNFSMNNWSNQKESVKILYCGGVFRVIDNKLYLPMYMDAVNTNNERVSNAVDMLRRINAITFRNALKAIANHKEIKNLSTLKYTELANLAASLAFKDAEEKNNSISQRDFIEFQQKNCQEFIEKIVRVDMNYYKVDRSDLDEMLRGGLH